MAEQKRGYLLENFRYFHIKDKTDKSFDYHFHDFNKVILFLSGDVTYYVEGHPYALEPGDILMVRHHSLHKPVISPKKTYERIVIWTRPGFLEHPLDYPENLGSCYGIANNEEKCLLRPNEKILSVLKKDLSLLEESLNTEGYADGILTATYFLQFFVHLNRAYLDFDSSCREDDFSEDELIDNVLKYIKTHLCEDISNDKIADEFFLNKYYLMHRFKEVTGYTIHSYITNKRLALASEAIKKGMPAMKAAEINGFTDYSTFLRAFRKAYGSSPKSLIKSGAIPGKQISI
ncbi:MAG: AraC family transcriptional regulator [Eubacterium sp.]|nr:AraC family transcriptional regulator [Eubacterium sp.]